MTEDRWIPSEEWETIVRNVPIPSVDLVVLHDEGILLGKRVNEPARGRWFVPGGRIRKQERIEDAVHRIAMEEIGVTIEIIERLGVYEHFYAAADVPTTDGKHYVPIGFTVKTDSIEYELTINIQRFAFSTNHPRTYTNTPLSISVIRNTSITNYRVRTHVVAVSRVNRR